MTILVVGATGATGRLLIEQLISQGHTVKVVVRSPDKLPSAVKNHPRLSVIGESILDLSDTELAEIVDGCAAVASCLGHTINWKGLFGHPRRLVTDAVRRLCTAIKSNEDQAPAKFVLMNTAGNSNRDISEPITFAQRCILRLIRLLLPPHADNEQAADYLRTVIGQHDGVIEWVVVRPDSLINEDNISEYVVHPSPTRSAIFNPGLTSRINVAHFMAELITNEITWREWQGQMPVIYNLTSS